MVKFALLLYIRLVQKELLGLVTNLFIDLIMLGRAMGLDSCRQKLERRIIGLLIAPVQSPKEQGEAVLWVFSHQDVLENHLHLENSHCTHGHD
jgi:hypothetical protein